MKYSEYFYIKQGLNSEKQRHWNKLNEYAQDEEAKQGLSDIMDSFDKEIDSLRVEETDEYKEKVNLIKTMTKLNEILKLDNKSIEEAPALQNVYFDTQFKLKNFQTRFSLEDFPYSKESGISKSDWEDSFNFELDTEDLLRLRAHKYKLLSKLSIIKTNPDQNDEYVFDANKNDIYASSDAEYGESARIYDYDVESVEINFNKKRLKQELDFVMNELSKKENYVVSESFGIESVFKNLEILLATVNISLQGISMEEALDILKKKENKRKKKKNEVPF